MIRVITLAVLLLVSLRANGQFLWGIGGGSGGGGGGGVNGPGSSVVNNIVVFANATGDLIGDSGIGVAAVLNRANHTGAQAMVTITGLSAALAAKADITSLGAVAFTSAYADLTGKPTLGTAAAKDIPAAGNASVTEVVYGTDTRLSDARTPTAHNHAASDITSGLLSASRGGSGVDGSAAANGRLLIGNGSGYTLANLTAGENFFITNGAGSIILAGKSNVTTVRGDLIYRGATAEVPLAIGDRWGYLVNDGTDPAWLSPRRGASVMDHFTFGINTFTTVQSGTGAAVAQSTITGTTNFGVIQLTTGSTSNAIAQTSHGITTGSIALDNGEVFWESYIRTDTAMPTAAEAYVVRAGLLDTTAFGASPTDGVYFGFDQNNGTNFVIVSRGGGVALASAVTTTQALPSTWYRLTIIINATRTSAAFYVNGVQVSGSPLVTLPTSAQLVSPVLCISKVFGTAARLLYSDYVHFAKNYTNPVP